MGQVAGWFCRQTHMVCHSREVQPQLSGDPALRPASLVECDDRLLGAHLERVVYDSGEATFAFDVNYPLKVAGFDPGLTGWFCPTDDIKNCGMGGCSCCRGWRQVYLGGALIYGKRRRLAGNRSGSGGDHHLRRRGIPCSEITATIDGPWTVRAKAEACMRSRGRME